MIQSDPICQGLPSVGYAETSIITVDRDFGDSELMVLMQHSSAVYLGKDLELTMVFFEKGFISPTIVETLNGDLLADALVLVMAS